jgi:hypothetical protein
MHSVTFTYIKILYNHSTPARAMHTAGESAAIMYILPARSKAAAVPAPLPRFTARTNPGSQPERVDFGAGSSGAPLRMSRAYLAQAWRSLMKKEGRGKQRSSLGGNVRLASWPSVQTESVTLHSVSFSFSLGPSASRAVRRRPYNDPVRFMSNPAAVVAVATPTTASLEAYGATQRTSPVALDAIDEAIARHIFLSLSLPSRLTCSSVRPCARKLFAVERKVVFTSSRYR